MKLYAHNENRSNAMYIGTSPQGVTFQIYSLIDGVEYCNQHELSIDDSIALGKILIDDPNFDELIERSNVDKHNEKVRY